MPCCAKSIHLWFFRDSICWALKAIAELRKSMPLFEALPHQLGIWSCLVPSPMLGCVIQNFIAFDSETAGVPCLIQVSIEDHLLPTPPPVAAALPLTCTVQDVVASINALWIFDVIGVSITVFDGILTFDAEDRFRPRLGNSYTIHVHASGGDEISTLQIQQCKRHELTCRDCGKLPVEAGSLRPFAGRWLWRL